LELQRGRNLRGIVEQKYHNVVHILVGGANGDHRTPLLSVNDPTFFLHHAMIDRIWSKWQDSNVRAGMPLEKQYHPTMSEGHEIKQTGHKLDEPMLPWSNEVEMWRWQLDAEDVTPRMVLDHR
jgi:tyrosinase